MISSANSLKFGYSIFSVISSRVIDAWCSEFLIIGLLYYARYYQGFLILSILAYSQSDIKYAVQREFYCRVVLSVGIIWHRSKTYTAGSAEDFYILVIDQST